MDFLPDVLGDVVTLDCINDILLVYTTSEREDVVVLKCTQSNTRSSNSETVNLFPLILLDVIDLTKSVDLAVYEGTDDVDKALNGT